MRVRGAVPAALSAAAALLVLAAASAQPHAAQAELRVVLQGPGSVATPSGKVACPPRCVASFAPGKVVTLTAGSVDGSDFTRWGGACRGTLKRCSLYLDRRARVTARFEPALVGVSVDVTGAGTVTSEPAGISCGPGSISCGTTVRRHGTLTLTPTPSPSGAFAGWFGACTGTGPCKLAPDEGATVLAVFRRAHAVTAAVTGAGNVESSLWPGCTAPCSAVSPSGATVTLRAVAPTAGSFARWSGACTGAAPTCVLRTDAPAAVVAVFGAAPALPGPGQPVRVTTAGPGRVSGGGISCGVTCAANVGAGTLDLVATPTPGAAFERWGGDCSGTAPTCRLTLSAAKAVTATFRRVFPLTVAAGSAPLELSIGSETRACPPQCTASVDAGSLVTLTPKQAEPLGPGQRRIAAWGGVCAGAGLACTVAVDAAASVSLKVAIASTQPAVANRYGLVVSLTRKGSVAATGVPLTCVRTAGPVACSTSVDRNRRVRLTATPKKRFAGWSGSCTGAAPRCELTMDAAKTVIARFAKP
jgi:hypothetical protein